jgi:integrase
MRVTGATVVARARFGHTPVTHSLRHRRISLLVCKEDPVVVARLVGRARASMSLDVYGHVLADERELDYAGLLVA